MKSIEIIKGKNIYLRELDLNDANITYLSWLNDPIINRFLEMRFNQPKSLIELQSFISNCLNNQLILLMGIFLNVDGVHVGNIKLGPINIHHKTADLGFLIGDKNQWGKGYATEAIKLMCEYGFTHIGLEKITAGALAQNIGSQKALLNSGFFQEGILRKQAIVDGSRQDGYIYGKLKC